MDERYGYSRRRAIGIVSVLRAVFDQVMINHDAVDSTIEALRDADRPLFVTHRHADRDSLGAAVGLATAMGRGRVCTPDGVAAPACPLLECAAAAGLADPIADPTAVDADIDAVVVLDASSSERIAPADPPAPILIDHHEPGDLSDRTRGSLIDTDAGATAELVAEIVRVGPWELTPEVALALTVGVFDDTDRLANATGRTIETFGQLIAGLGPMAADLSSLLEPSPAAGERTARALAMLRADGYRAGDIVVAVTTVGGHEGAAADALCSTGIDLAVVRSRQGDRIRVVARASDRIATRLSVGADLLPAVTETLGGDGGGHDDAGAATLETDDIDAVEATLVAFLERELGVTVTEVVA